MDSERQLAMSRRTLLRGAALTALTALALPSAPAHAAVPERPGSAKPKPKPHPSYTAIVGLL
ncbi:MULTISPECIES: hypothetical protein [Streptomyces]|uniref:hypothetical protein n=1 Tax=Streptomyces TaxID=1883 RepID=UPI001489FBC4|nr:MULTISPECIES: hypothetical protein [Streptomyces]